MKAVHFGAGSIGRGFIGDLLFASGYATTFIDVNQDIISQMNQTNSYDLFVIEDDYKKKTIKNVQALSSISEEEKVVEAIVQANVITTSVWANNLSKIAPVILKGLLARREHNKPTINILACENAMFNSDILKNHILELTDITADELKQLAHFPNTAVDRLVLEDHVDGQNVINIGKDFELVIEKNKLVDPNEVPIKGADYTNDLQQYIEKKLYIINGGHAWAGYIGYVYGYDIIQDVFNQKELVTDIRETMIECARLLTHKYSFTLEELVDYVDFAIGRFQTPGIQDTINRVCRSPIRKLQPEDRLVGPAIQSEQYGLKSEYLLKGIAAAFLFENVEDDEANQIHQYVAENGIENAITHYTSIEHNSPLFASILAEYNVLKDIKAKHRAE